MRIEALVTAGAAAILIGEHVALVDVTETVTDIGLQITGNINGCASHKGVSETPLAPAAVFGGRVAAKTIDTAGCVAQLVPLDVGAADTTADIRRHASVSPEIDVGICHQSIGANRAKILRDAAAGNGTAETARGATKIRLAHIVEGHVTAEIVVELITDTGANDIAIVDLRCIEISEIATRATLIIIGTTQLIERITDVATQIPAACLGDLHFGSIGRRRLSLIKIGGNGAGAGQQDGQKSGQGVFHDFHSRRGTCVCGSRCQ